MCTVHAEYLPRQPLGAVPGPTRHHQAAAIHPVLILYNRAYMLHIYYTVVTYGILTLSLSVFCRGRAKYLHSRPPNAAAVRTAVSSVVARYAAQCSAVFYATPTTTVYI